MTNLRLVPRNANLPFELAVFIAANKDKLRNLRALNRTFWEEDHKAIDASYNPYSDPISETIRKRFNEEVLELFAVTELKHQFRTYMESYWDFIDSRFYNKLRRKQHEKASS